MDESQLLAALANHADAADNLADWPAASLQLLGELGGWRWIIPPEFGGLGCQAAPLHRHYQQLARACLTTCFLLSQRDAAARRIAASDNTELCRELLPPLARGERFATVGIAQITTSRQHTRPAMQAKLDASHIGLNGSMPWVTGADRAAHIITGAVLEDGRQVLVALPRQTPGVCVDAALELMALRGSCTTQVRCEEVKVDRHWLLAGPSERVLGADAAGGLTTSCLALGLAEAATNYLRQEAEARPELASVAERLERRRRTLWEQLLQLAHGSPSADDANRLRSQANLLVLQVTQTALTASKGSGFVHPHPAQRWARQALFFLVWSCPRPTAELMLECLAPE
jgi:alkylation response protein AidB-like acyl-CoA dehydrogenase